MKNKQQVSNGSLVALIILENLFLYYFFRNGIFTQGKNAIGLFLTSILFGIVVIYKFYNTTIEVAPARPAKKNILSYGLLLLLITGLVLLGVQYNAFFHERPISLASSDIFPVIQVMSRRFVNGQTPYCIFNDFGYPIETGYLPMQWMPFSIAELLHIDYRWIAYGAWCIAAILLCIRSIKIPSPIIRGIVPILIFASNYVLFNSYDKGIVEATAELLISAYYMILISGLNQKNGILQGIIISFCLLSRYSLVLWIPLFCFILFVTQNRRQLYIAAATTAVMVAALYVIPFLSKDWGMFYRDYKGYDGAAHFEWTHLNKDGNPIHLFSGTGMAYYFYSRFTNLDVMDRVKLLQRTHLVCSILITVVMGVWFWFKKEKINYKIFTISSFKIYLTVFLFLIQVPYVYLMCVGNFVTIAIFCEQARYRVKAAPGRSQGEVGSNEVRT